jgi:leucyl aminopeptidase (aminopeptidase T)
VDDATLGRYAKLIVEVGANVQPGQTVWVVAEPRASSTRGTSTRS